MDHYTATKSRASATRSLDCPAKSACITAHWNSSRSSLLRTMLIRCVRSCPHGGAYGPSVHSEAGSNSTVLERPCETQKSRPFRLYNCYGAMKRFRHFMIED